MKSVINIYYRRLVRWRKIPVLKRLKVHPIIRMGELYYELSSNQKLILILTGKLKDMSPATQAYMKRKPEPDKKETVNRTKFLETVKRFKKMHDGETYNLLNLRTNSKGFLNYVLRESKI